MKVLGLTTTGWRSFYEQQVGALDSVGIDYTSREVSGDHRAFHDDVQRRSAIDYLRFIPEVIAEYLAGYDLVHANYGMSAPYAIANPTTPAVVSLWGGELVGNRYAPLIRAAIRRADALIVPSEVMLDRLPSGVRDRTSVVPFPVDTDEFVPAPTEQARERVGWDPDTDVVLFPYAKSRYEKNYALASRVVDGLDADVELRAVANEPYERMSDYLNASDALLVTSRWESGPMTIKEALACELPVVSRPVGFAPSVLDDLDHCHVAATERGLREGLRTALATDESPGGRERVATYGREEMGTRLRSIYADCLA